MPEILFEYIRQGNSVKVTAIDSASKTEVVTIVPIGLSENQMQKIALDKLNYVLGIKNNKDCG